MDKKKQPLLILTGPTAVGKTSLSICLAKAVGGEIISADSMQVYRHMDIGSAKVTKEEMEGIPHHLIDVLEPEEDFHVVRFQELAKEALEGIYKRGRIPIVAGGTGFYIQALLYNIDFKENQDGNAVRNELERLAEEKGPHILHEMLREVDEKSAEVIHENNVKRVIRALEYFRQTGERMSDHNEEERQKESPYNFLYYVVNTDRELLYQRIDSRVDQMVEAGLVEEVRSLKERGLKQGMVSMQGLGYKEILNYLDGNCSLEDAIYVLKRDTRHFAKRQLTWFRRERAVRWLNLPDFQNNKEKIIEKIIEDCRKQGILP